VKTIFLIFDLITTFDVIHDMIDLLVGVSCYILALKPSGTNFWLETSSKDKLKDTIGSLSALFS
jgi:hypothetical protein